ncbi:MAG: hypothetical protein OXC01_13765 [Immundisolibacterales bacterium]|nr:hypothetical protein [Immundisolibacterales bacterium]
MNARARNLVFAAAAGAILLTVDAAADDAGERAFANELRILPAFTAQLDHTVVQGTRSSRDTARLEMDPARRSFRLCYETLPIEIWRVGRKVVTVPTGEGRPARDRALSAGKLAALLFMVGSGVASKHMEVALEPKETQVDYVLSPRNEGNPIAWIRYEFDDVGLLRASVLERSGELHRIVLSERKPVTESEPEAAGAPAAATISI